MGKEVSVFQVEIDFPGHPILIAFGEKDFIDEAGRQFLYLSFPQGLVSQGSPLAGVLEPPYSHDNSLDSDI